MADKIKKPTGAGGGADSGLELGEEKDRRLLRRAVKERWPIPYAKREKIANQLIKVAIDPKSDARAVASAARTLARMDQLNQADEHAERHYERIDDGLPTERVSVINDLV